MIETARKEDLFLDKKLIIPENRLDAIRIMARLHPVVGDQPTNEKNQPNTNNPVLDLACTILNIHESGVGVHADLRKIQNEPPKYFYGKGFMSGISNLKGNGILAVYGHWRDGSGRYAIKQFYYTDKEIVWRNAISDTAWSQWFDVLTGNSDLDYNKLLNVPITSTLSDSKTQIASIFAVNQVNRAAVNAQKTANTANANAVNAMNEALKKVDPKDVKSFYLLDKGSYYANESNGIDVDTRPFGDYGLFRKDRVLNYPFMGPNGYIKTELTYSTNSGVQWGYSYEDSTEFGFRMIHLGRLKEWAWTLHTNNTSIDSKGVVHKGQGTPKDVLLVGDLGLGGNGIWNDSLGATVYRPNGFYRVSGNDDGYPSWKRSGDSEIRSSWSSSYYSILFFGQSAKRYAIKTVANNVDKGWSELLTDDNTTSDPAGFLRSFGNAVALTTDNLTSDLKVNRSDLVASAKYAYDVYQAALAADGKAVKAQQDATKGINDAAAADKKAANAQTRADSAFSKVKPITEGGTGATTAANARKNLGIQTTNVLVVTGTIAHGGTIPIPAGFSVSECSFFVSTDKMNPEEEKWDIQETSRQMHFKSECFVSNRVVTCRMWVGTHYGPTHTTDPSRWINGIANYMVIGVKK